MNDKIDIESQFKSKLKQYCLSRFYNTFIKHNVSCVNDIAFVPAHKFQLKSIENGIFSFGKNKLKQKHFQMFIRHVTCKEDYKLDMDMYNKEKKKEENEKKEFNNISQFNMSMISPTLTATTALTTQFYSNMSLNESAINDGDSILLGTTSVSNTYINSIHDTMSTSDTLSNYNSNHIGSSNQAQYFESVQESQSQSQSQSMGMQYQQPWPSVATSAVATNDGVLIHSSANTSIFGNSVLRFDT